VYEGRGSDSVGTAPCAASAVAAPCPGLLAEPVSDKCFGGAKAPEGLLAPSSDAGCRAGCCSAPARQPGCLIPQGSPALPTLLD